METMRRHFVTFYSPGTFVAETSTREIESWDVEKAGEMSRGIVERYDARPYGFRFSTRERGPDDLDSRVTETSGMYYISGDVLTLEEIEARKDERDKILIQNMRGNGWDRAVETKTPWAHVQPLEEGDVVLSEATP